MRLPRYETSAVAYLFPRGQSIRNMHIHNLPVPISICIVYTAFQRPIRGAFVLNFS